MWLLGIGRPAKLARCRNRPHPGLRGLRAPTIASDLADAPASLCLCHAGTRQLGRRRTTPLAEAGRDRPRPGQHGPSRRRTSAWRGSSSKSSTRISAGPGCRAAVLCQMRLANAAATCGARGNSLRDTTLAGRLELACPALARGVPAAGRINRRRAVSLQVGAVTRTGSRPRAYHSHRRANALFYDRKTCMLTSFATRHMPRTGDDHA